MFAILDHIQKLFLSLAKRCLPACLLRYLLALYRTIFRILRRCKLKSQESSHEPPSPETPVIAEGKASSHEGSLDATVRRAVSGSYPPVQSQASVGVMEHSGATNDDGFKYRCKPPLKRGVRYWITLGSLFDIVVLFDHPGFIRRALAQTEVKDGSGTIYTDVEKWCEFSRMYAEHIDNVTLLGTVILATNVSFLAIQSVDSAPDGLSSLPQQLSYVSLVAALTSILAGSAVRSPRFFTNYGAFYSKAIQLILISPFQLFVYSAWLFYAAILSHCFQYEGSVQIIVAFVLCGSLMLSIVGYWLVTDPLIPHMDNRKPSVTCEGAPFTRCASYHTLPPQPC